MRPATAVAQQTPPLLDPAALPSPPAPAEKVPARRAPAKRGPKKPEARPAAPDAPASPRPLPWTFALGYTQAWDDNPLFAAADPLAGDVPGAAGGGSWNGRVSSDLSHRQHGAHSDVVLDGRAEGWVQRDPSRRDRLTYALSGKGGFDLTPRLRATLDESWQTAYTDEAPALALQGIVLQTVLARTNLATAGLAYRTSERTVLSADARDERVSFSEAALVGYSRLRGTVTASHRLASRDALEMSAALEERRSLGRSARGISAGPGWEHGFGARVLARVAAGVQVFDALDTGARHVQPYARGTLGGRFRRTLLTLTASHELAPGYEDGRDRMADLAVVAATRDIGRRFGLFTSASAIRRRDLDVDGLRGVMLYVGSGVSWRLTRGLEARLTHTFERSREQLAGADPALVRRRQRVDLFLGYRRDW